MADEGISAGEVHVTVQPRVAADWSAKVLGETRGSASKVGDDLGDRIGKAISKRIATSIRDGISLGGKGLGGEGGRAGADYGDKFSTVVKQRIAAALRDLPTPTIGVATTEAEQKIKDLHGQLSTLSARVGVDLSGEEALAEVRRIREELDRLRASSADVTVRTNTAAAISELAAVDEAIRRIDGRDAKVDVNTNADEAASRMQLLVSAGLALGPAIVPGAVAAAAAVLSIGSAATSAFVGLGVGALAFHGIADGVKALDTAQQQALKTGSTLASQQKSLAGGADQVRSAEASLANARAQAADGAVRAEQQVAAAQAAATRAQRDLNDAIDAERQSRQDLSQNIKGNALDQQQAALDVTKARVAYEQQASEQNRISYEQAKLRAEDLGIQGKRLAAEQATNNKTTVEGSRRVTDAKAKEVAAQQAVADAERARTAQARQSAQQIAQASQAVITAQRGIAAATVAAGATGGAAIDALAVSMGNLPVSGQAFARFLFGLKGRLDDLKASAADGILPGAQQGIQILLPYLGDLEGVVGNVADEIGSLEVRAARTFSNPFWQQFFVGFLGGQAVPNLELMYTAGLNVAEAGARIVQGFSPVQREVGGGILELTQRFVDFSRSLDSNRGFQNFVAFAQAEVPHVLSTIEALASAGLHIVQGYAPVGSVVVSELKLLAQVIDAIPVPVITALAFAITAYKTAALLSAGAQNVLNSSLLTGIGRMVTYRTETDLAGKTTTAFSRTTTAASSFLGGPFGILLGVGALAISYFANQSQQAKQKVDDLANAASRYGQILKDGVTPESASAAADALRQNDALAGLVETTKEAGIASSTLVDALNGDAAARDQVVASLNQQIDAEKLAASEARNGGDADTKASKSHRDRAEALETMRDGLVKSNTGAAEALKLTDELTGATGSSVDAFRNAATALSGTAESAGTYAAGLAAINSISADATAKSGAFAAVAQEVADSNLSAADKTKLFGTVLNDLGSSAGASGPVFDGLAAVFTTIGNAAIGARDKAALLKQTLDQLYGAAISQTEAAEAQVRTMGALDTQLANNSAGFDLNSAKTDKNRAAILGNRDALESALQAAREKYIQDVANTGNEELARQTHDKTVQSIVDGIPKTQRQSAAVKDLVTQYGAIPPSKKTDVSSPGLDAAVDKLIEAHAVDFALSQSPPLGKDFIVSEIDYLKKKISGASSIAVSKATGGAIQGPGTETSDSIPAWLSTGEHVLTAAEVKAAGGHGNVYALREMMLRGDLKGLLPGFATGGAVWPVTVKPNIAVPNIADLWAKWQAAIAAASGDVGGADLGIARTIADVARQLKADRKVLLSAMETALVESGMHNLKYGDRDSLGVFQQRPSQGWGSPAEILNVAHAARSYLVRAIANEPRYAKGTAGQLAQSVQRSAFPGRYDQRAGQAEAIITALSGGAVASGLGAASGAGGYKWQEAVLRKAFPNIAFFSDYRPGAITVSGNQSYHAVGRAVDMSPRGDVFEWIRANYGARTKELIFTPKGARQLKNGQPHVYGPEIAATHGNHVHWAYKGGGAVGLDGGRILPPELLKRLQLSNLPYGVYDSGRGVVPPGLSIMDNRTRAPEVAAVLNTDTLGRLGGQPPHVEVHNYLDGREIASRTEVIIDQKLDRVASLVGSGVRDY